MKCNHSKRVWSLWGPGLWAAAVILLGGLSFAQPGPAQARFEYPFQDFRLPLEKRVDDLLTRLTLEEKIGQMRYEAAAIPRFGIPEYNWWNECLHGVARNGTATVFPQAIGLAATWDPGLLGRMADTIATEARAKHHEDSRHDHYGIYQGLTFWSPNINIFRDPRWGRGQETYGEDPFLTSRLGVAFVRGLQGGDPQYYKVIATPKHFAVHSGPEPLRHTFDARPTLRDLYETYLPAFEACVREGKAGSVMGAYNRFLGLPCCASQPLLGDVLRDRWGFQGYVVSDCWAIWDIYAHHHFVTTAAEAAALAVKAGCDLECGDDYRALGEAVAKGLITEKEIDRAVRRLLSARFKLGMFDPPEEVPYARIPFAENDSPAHDELARQVARESIVLLKNENNTLPLRREVKSIAVIGPYADNIDVLLGNYNGTPSHPVTIRQGIQNKAGEHTRVTYHPGVQPLEIAVRMRDIGSEVLKPPPGHEGHGLIGEYFADPDLQGKPVLVRVDGSARWYWGLDSPGPGIPKDHFSVRWTGKLVPPETGRYRIGITTDDKGRLYLDGKLVVDNWAPFEVNVLKTCELQLEKAHEYDLRLEYAEETGYAGIGLQWVRLQGDDKLSAGISEAVALVPQAEAVVIVAGISAQLEGEEMSVDEPGFKGGDRTSLELPELQHRLIRAVAATGKPVVLVLTSGSPLAINWEKEHLSAIVQAWYPGQQGGNAVADVLFGDYNPAGRLPVTFYRSVDDLPPFEDYHMAGRTYRYFRGEPLFPFGHGLSYTQFEYKWMKVKKTQASVGGTVDVRVKLANTGRYAGDEVVQLYTRCLSADLESPIKSLKGFQRVHLAVGETRVVDIAVPVRELRYFDEEKNDYTIAAGRYEIQVGTSSADIRLKKTISVSNR